MWSRLVRNAGSSEAYEATDGGVVVLTVRIDRTGPAGYSNCPSGLPKVDAQDAIHHASTESLYDVADYCFEDGGTGVQVHHLVTRPGYGASIRAFVNTVLRQPQDASGPQLPDGWVHDPAVANGMMRTDATHLGRAYLFDATSAPPCVGQPVPGADTIACTRDGVSLRRLTSSQMALDVVADPDTTSWQADLFAWFRGLPPGTLRAQPLVLAPVPPEGTPALTSPVAPLDSSSAAASPPAGSYSDWDSSRSGRHHYGAGAGNGGPAGRYEFLARYSWASLPIDLEYFAENEPNHVAWYGEQVWGGTIIEHGPGIISRINALFLAGAGAQWYQNTTTGEVFHENSDVALGQEASWTVDASSSYWAFRADSWWFKWFGWRFGGWHVTELSSDINDSKMPGPSADLVARYKALAINSNYGIEIEFMMRYQKWLPALGLFSASIDLPVTYLCGIAFFRDARGMLYTWGGVPRIQGDIARRVGPLMFHVTASSPTGWLVIPLKSGQQLTLSGGVTF